VNDREARAEPSAVDRAAVVDDDFYTTVVGRRAVNAPHVEVGDERSRPNG
jgi:hypothetical protein